MRYSPAGASRLPVGWKSHVDVNTLVSPGANINVDGLCEMLWKYDERHTSSGKTNKPPKNEPTRLTMNSYCIDVGNSNVSGSGDAFVIASRSSTGPSGGSVATGC